MKWTENNIGDLKSKTIIVTGGNSGLGFESCKLYSKYGATVILASRSEERGIKAKNKILKEYPNSLIEVMVLDLGSKESIKTFVETFNKSYSRLDILLNNAGVMTPPYQSTTDGFESQIGVNHLGHFYLTGLLFPIIKNTENARIVNISSLAHLSGRIDLNSFNYEEGKSYEKMKAYAQSKLANLLFTKELSRKLIGNNIKVLAAHPGVSNTNLSRHMKSTKMFNLISQNQYKGCLPGIRASVDNEAVSGDYYGPRGLIGMKGYPKKRKSNRRSNNEELAKSLWEYSEKLLNFSFEV